MTILRTLSPRSEDQTYCHTHSNSLSNKMDNSLLAVRGINHKYIVIGGDKMKRKVVKVKVTAPKDAKKVTICSQAVTND